MLLILGAIVLVFLVLLCGLLIYLCSKQYNQHERYKEFVQKLILEGDKNLYKVKSDLTKERGRNKRVEVRTGFIMEKISPFTEAFGENPKNAKHLGDPIDFVCFSEKGITFVEVKTGKARLTPKQNKIKKQVEEGKVFFKTVRFDYE